ncbi:MAG TPA: ThiF family adenylyltransferase [Hanamia sp.]
MSQQLINHSPDLKRLRDEGYEIELCGGYLLIHHVPYLNNKKEINFGTLICVLTLSNNTTTGKPHDHIIYFKGEIPCDNEGNTISAIYHSSPVAKELSKGVAIDHLFSNKPVAGYPDYYEKVKRYADLTSAPAKYLNDSLTEKTFRAIAAKDDESVFYYIDTNSSRANIDRINSKFNGQKIAIVGLGGTGAYILDLVSKTPVLEIHPFDGDVFQQHNAFRSPGAASLEDVDKNTKKADYFAAIYSKMHKGISPHSYYVTDDNLCELDNMSYVFICVDKNSVRKRIADYLVKKGITFIDVGLGVNVVDDKINGAIRVTTGTPTKNDHLHNRIFSGDNENNDYTTNIQIADLNLLNAGLAVIKWKKISDFYADLEREHHCSYSISVSKIFNEDAAA